MNSNATWRKTASIVMVLATLLFGVTYLQPRTVPFQNEKIISPERPVVANQSGSPEVDVSFSTSKNTYSKSEDVSATIKNDFDTPIWIYTACDDPFYVLNIKKEGDWERRSAHPTKDCNSNMIQMKPGEGITRNVDLEQLYAIDIPWFGTSTYKFELHYRITDPLLPENAQIQPYVTYSNEFSI